METDETGAPDECLSRVKPKEIGRPVTPACPDVASAKSESYRPYEGQRSRIKRFTLTLIDFCLDNGGHLKVHF